MAHYRALQEDPASGAFQETATYDALISAYLSLPTTQWGALSQCLPWEFEAIRTSIQKRR